MRTNAQPASRTPARGVADEELVHLIGAGDRASLGLLFARHRRAVGQFLAALEVAPCDVDDVVQQTFPGDPARSRALRSAP